MNDWKLYLFTGYAVRGVSYLLESEMFGCHVFRKRNDVEVFE